jgi:hypothetical protein
MIVNTLAKNYGLRDNTDNIFVDRNLVITLNHEVYKRILMIDFATTSLKSKNECIDLILV